nr:Zn-finger_in_Ran_binding_protein_and_others_putative/Pfam:PF00641 [Leishmania donovani]
MQDEDGLNDFGQPCIDYLQGHCSWGDSCRLYHPPGEEGSLPAECRMGDWKCSACGVINRHFRRRCSNCVREKPQYKKGRVPSAEDKLLCTPDPAVTAAFHQQFGYNPYMPAEAVAHFKLRLEGVSAEEYRKERAAAYRVRILGKAPTNPVEERCKATKHFPDIDMEPDEEYEVGTDGLVAKRQRTESLVPANASPNSAIALLAQLVMERGILDPTVPQIFGELSRYIRQAAGDPAMELNETQAEVLLSACKLGFTAWNANKGAVPSVATFFKAVRHNESKLGLSSEQAEQLESMASMFLA